MSRDQIEGGNVAALMFALMMNGSHRFSYCAASTRNTNTSPAFDAATGDIVMVTSGPDHPLGNLVHVNGSLTPEPIALHAGVPQRSRLINMTTVSTDIVVSLQGAADGRWTPIAKDGIDLDLRLQQARTATSQLTIGETRDFRFTPTAPGDLTLQMFDTGTKVGSVTLRLVPRCTQFCYRRSVWGDDDRYARLHTIDQLGDRVTS